MFLVSRDPSRWLPGDALALDFSAVSKAVAELYYRPAMSFKQINC